MKLRALVMTLAIAALGVSVAAATASPDHGKPPHPGAQKPTKPSKPSKPAKACKGPQVVLMGTYVSGSAGSDGAGSFAMVVNKTNRPGRRLGLVAGSQVSVNVDARTRTFVPETKDARGALAPGRRTGYLERGVLLSRA